MRPQQSPWTEGQAYVFVSVDHCTFECTGLHAPAQGNGCAERFIRLLKENLLWVKSFATIEELRQALIAFKHQYYQQWILQRHDYKTRRKCARTNAQSAMLTRRADHQKSVQ